MTIAYLVSEYPAPSHTFVRREVSALRAHGLSIRTYSIQRGSHADGDTLGAAALAETFAVQSTSVVAVAGANLAALVRSPVRFARTLALALRHRVPGARALLWSLFHFAEAILLARHLAGDGISHLHNHFANSGATVGMLTANFLGIPWSLSLHGISEFDYPAGNLLPEKLARAQFAACVSRFGMAQAMRVTGPDLWPKLTIVRCAIDPSILPTGVERRADGQFRLIAVGRLSPEKGQSGLLDAVASMIQGGSNVRLTMVGDGPEEQRLKAKAVALGIADRVHFTGRLDEAGALAAIAAADALVLTSFMEGLPVVLMEALALNVPVVASRVAGVPELVEDGVTGLLITPADWPGFAAALSRLEAEPGLRAKLAREGQQRVGEEFSYPAAAEPMAGLLMGRFVIR